jgi:cyclophilin family peptidyl-prolyl cis-trans isomerase
MHKARLIWMMLVMSVLSLAVPSAAQTAIPPRAAAPSPNEIVATAKADEWVTIAPADLLVMDLAPDAKAKPRRVVIQLMPAPFSQGWISNIRKLAAAHWWDGLSVNRVQDNYVAQWGDVTEKKALPDGLMSVPESEYAISYGIGGRLPQGAFVKYEPKGSYAEFSDFIGGWQISFKKGMAAPTHCYAMVGVGRNLSPDTGTGAELYTVIGHAPRHLDRNIALVGRVIEGIEHLSSLPRGAGALGFYTTAEERVPILSIRLATDLPSDKPLPRFQYLSTKSPTFAAYADARANRRDPFFIVPAGGADICNIPVPIRRAP